MIEFSLHKVLLKRDMNKTQLAEITGIRRDTITAIVNGDIKRIPVDALDKICYALNCQLSDIMSYTDQEWILAKPNGVVAFGPSDEQSCILRYRKLIDEGAYPEELLIKKLTR